MNWMDGDWLSSLGDWLTVWLNEEADELCGLRKEVNYKRNIWLTQGLIDYMMNLLAEFLTGLGNE